MSSSTDHLVLCGNLKKLKEEIHEKQLFLHKSHKFLV